MLSKLRESSGYEKKTLTYRHLSKGDAKIITKALLNILIEILIL